MTGTKRFCFAIPLLPHRSSLSIFNPDDLTLCLTTSVEKLQLEVEAVLKSSKSRASQLSKTELHTHRKRNGSGVTRKALKYLYSNFQKDLARWTGTGSYGETLGVGFRNDLTFRFPSCRLQSA